MACESCEDPKKACPLRMSAGRPITDYSFRCTQNAKLLQGVKDAGMTLGSYEMRRYLQLNSEAIMQKNREEAAARLSPCFPCTRPFNEPGTMLPERYEVVCNGVTCERKEVNPTGLGDGRKY